MKESHEVQEIRQGPSDDAPSLLASSSALRLASRVITVGYLLCHRNADGLDHGCKASSAASKSITIPGNLTVRSRAFLSASGGANPSRAVLLTGGRFLYVLNRGTDCRRRTIAARTDVCSNANITQFSVGGNGMLTPQGTYLYPGNQPLPHDCRLPRAAILCARPRSPPNGTGCALVFGATITTCGDITAFKIDSTTGRLSLSSIHRSPLPAARRCPTSRSPPTRSTSSLLANYFLTLSGNPDDPRRLGLSLHLQRGERPADHQPEQLAAAWHLARQRRSFVPAARSTCSIMAPTTNTAALPMARFFPSPSGANGSLQAQAGGIYSRQRRPTPTPSTSLAGKRQVLRLRRSIRATMPTRTECSERHRGIHDYRPRSSFSRFPAQTGQLAAPGWPAVHSRGSVEPVHLYRQLQRFDGHGSLD